MGINTRHTAKANNLSVVKSGGPPFQKNPSFPCMYKDVYQFSSKLDDNRRFSYLNKGGEVRGMRDPHSQIIKTLLSIYGGTCKIIS